MLYTGQFDLNVNLAYINDMPLTSIVLLLQTALSLLANPSLTASQRVQALDFANQAIIIAEESVAVQAQATPVPLVVGQDTQSNPIGGDLAPTVSPVENIPEEPMCTYLVPGVGTKIMTCAAIQACSLAHNCPIINPQ